MNIYDTVTNRIIEALEGGIIPWRKPWTNQAGIEELVAEMGSAFLCAESVIAGDDGMDNSVAYIQSWLRHLRNDKTLVVSAAQKAQRAVDYILGKAAAETVVTPAPVELAA